MNVHLPQPPDSKSLAARDRALLYTRGMDISPEKGVALALESLRRAGPEADAGRVMGELFAVLREHDRSPIIPGLPVPPDREGEPLACVPPINRTVVLPKDMEPLSLTAALAQWLRSLFRRISGKRKTCNEG